MRRASRRAVLWPEIPDGVGMGRSPTWVPRLLAACILSLPAARVHAGETCMFSGSTDYGGRLKVSAESGSAGGRTGIDVQLELDATPLPLIHTRYVMEEISSWRENGIEQVAVNDRYSVDGHIVRQQWDVYNRAPDGLHAYRVQGKRRGEFQRQHPGFVQFWNPDAFGKPWLAAYPYSIGTRRPDLDLHQDPSLVRTPLAFAFYWLGWLPRQGGVVPLFLPGFKERKLVQLPIAPMSDREAGRVSGWRAPVEYPYLSATRPSVALAWTTGDRHVRQLLLDLHGVEHSARGSVHANGCRSSAPPT